MIVTTDKGEFLYKCCEDCSFVNFAFGDGYCGGLFAFCYKWKEEEELLNAQRSK